MLHCLWEIIDNSVDEALHGTCTSIDVILHADHSAEVRDNGRGIPVDIEPKTGLNGVELVMTRLHAGGKFGGGSYTASGGLHGVGASVVNALSGRLDVVRRAGGLRVGRQLPARRAGRVRRRRPGRQLHAGLRAAQGRARSRRRRPAPGPGSGRTGRSSSRGPTWPSSRSSSGPGRPPTWCPGCRSRSPTSARGRGDEADGQRRTAEFKFDGGISEFCAHLSTGAPVTDVLRLTGRRPVHRDGAGPGRPGPPDARPRSSGSLRSTSRCAGTAATTRPPARSST